MFLIMVLLWVNLDSGVKLMDLLLSILFQWVYREMVLWSLVLTLKAYMVMRFVGRIVKE